RAAHEEEAAEGAGIPAGTERGRSSHHLRRHVRHHHQAEGGCRAAADRSERQGGRIAGLHRRLPGAAARRVEFMNKNLRWKILLCLAVLILFGVAGVYPILASMYHLPAPQAIMNKQLKLGLDLKGGVHLVLRVKTDTALRVETELEMQRVAEAART